MLASQCPINCVEPCECGRSLVTFFELLASASGALAKERAEKRLEAEPFEVAIQFDDGLDSNDLDGLTD